MFKFKNGQQVKDSITGYKGTIIGRADYMTGCRQYHVQTKVDKSNDTRAWWLDEDRLVLLKAPAKKITKRNTGGPQAHPTKI